MWFIDIFVTRDFLRLVMRKLHHDTVVVSRYVPRRREFLRLLPASLVVEKTWPQSPALAGAGAVLDVPDFEALARKALAPAHWGYLATGVDCPVLVWTIDVLAISCDEDRPMAGRVQPGAAAQQSGVSHARRICKRLLRAHQQDGSNTRPAGPPVVRECVSQNGTRDQGFASAAPKNGAPLTAACRSANGESRRAAPTGWERGVTVDRASQLRLAEKIEAGHQGRYASSVRVKSPLINATIAKFGFRGSTFVRRVCHIWSMAKPTTPKL